MSSESKKRRAETDAKASEPENKEKRQKEEENKPDQKTLKDFFTCPCDDGDFLVDPVVTPCGHTFCKECITKWVSKQGTCPVCRGEIPKNTEFKVSITVRQAMESLGFHRSDPFDDFTDKADSGLFRLSDDGSCARLFFKERQHEITAGDFRNCFTPANCTITVSAYSVYFFGLPSATDWACLLTISANRLGLERKNGFVKIKMKSRPNGKLYMRVVETAPWLADPPFGGYTPSSASPFSVSIDLMFPCHA
jgi:hypothetical protein